MIDGIEVDDEEDFSHKDRLVTDDRDQGEDPSDKHLKDFFE